MFKAYVISLKEPDKLITSLENKGVLARWVEAIDGKKINNKIIKKNTTLFYSIFGSKNSIAIAMSHMKAWKTFLKTNQQYTIIFEDDVIIENDFAEKLSINLKNTPNDYDLLYLGCFGCKKSPNVLSTIFSFLGEGNVDYRDINDYINKPFIAVALHSYVISRQGAIKLLKLLEGKIYYYLDYCIQNLSSNNLINVYSLNERIAFQSSTDSDISSTASNSHPFLLNKPLSRFYIDEKCRASYLTTVSIFRIGDFNITISSLLFLVLGIILAKHLSNKDNYDDIIEATFLYLIISLPDIINNMDTSKDEIIIKSNELDKAIKIHYILFIIPFFVMKNL
jgi:GR25 family glycosyltransferase involved in LPS biosynthesis